MLKGRLYTGVILILAFLASQFNSLHLHAHTSVPHKHEISAKNANHSLEETCNICDAIFAPALHAARQILVGTNLQWIGLSKEIDIQFTPLSQKSFPNKAPPICS